MNVLSNATKYNLTDTIRAELPSSNGHTNAKSMAKLAALIANNGILDGVRLISEETIDLLHGNPTIMSLYGLNVMTKFT